MKIGVVLNPSSRAGSSPSLRRTLERRLQAHDLSIRSASGLREARALTCALLRSGVDTIVAAGGDGTVNAVVNGMMGSACRLGILPVGTANDFAASLDIPANMEDACEVILDGTSLPIDVIRVNSWHFVTAGGIGLPVDVVELVDVLRRRSRLASGLARTLGPALYPVAMLCRLLGGARVTRTVELQLDGRRMRFPVHALLVANLRSVGRYLQIAPQASVFDGLLHLFVLEDNGSRLALAASALRTLNGSAARGRCVRMFSGRRLTLSTSVPISLCADGELGVRGSTFEFEVIPGGLDVCCPRQAAHTKPAADSSGRMASSPAGPYAGALGFYPPA